MACVPEDLCLLHIFSDSVSQCCSFPHHHVTIFGLGTTRDVPWLGALCHRVLQWCCQRSVPTQDTVGTVLCVPVPRGRQDGAELWHPEVTLSCDPMPEPSAGGFWDLPSKSSLIVLLRLVGSQVGTGTSSPPCPSTQRCSQDPSTARGRQQLVNH